MPTDYYRKSYDDYDYYNSHASDYKRKCRPYGYKCKVSARQRAARVCSKVLLAAASSRIKQAGAPARAQRVHQCVVTAHTTPLLPPRRVVRTA
jgi:hypothetical protein